MSIQVRSNDKPITEAPEVKAAVSEAKESKKADPSAPEASATEQKESPESDTEGTEAEGSETEPKEPKEPLESEPEQEAEPEEPQGTENDRPKKKGGFQRRIDKLNARYAQKEQELEYWKQQALTSAGPSKTDAPRVESKSQATDGKPNAEKFDTHSEYVEALTDWKVDQKQKEFAEKQEKSKLQSEQEKLIRTHCERVSAFSAKTEDFQEALEGVDDIPVSPAVREIILQADNGPELMYELAKNREEYARICKLAPLAAARELGKIESRLASRAPAEKNRDPKKITQAPKPLEPVGTGGKGSTPKSIFDPNISQADYERLRKEQMKKRRQT